MDMVKMKNQNMLCLFSANILCLSMSFSLFLSIILSCITSSTTASLLLLLFSCSEKKGNMDLVRELFFTAVMAVLFSFLIAKLVSLVSSGHSGTDSKCKNVGQEITGDVIMGELRFNDKLETEGFKNEKRAQEVVRGVVEKVDELVESENCGEIIGIECGELTQEMNQEGLKEEEKSPEKEVWEKKEGESVAKDVFEQSKEKNGQFVSEEVDEENIEDDAIGEESAVCIDIVKKSEEIVAEESELKEKVEEKKSVEIVSDEDDWEGIERSELEKVFTEAAKFVESEERDEKLVTIGSDVQMELYGLHKVATEGPCREQPPMALKVSARAKWNAWRKLGNMSPEAAMEQYVTLVSDRVPGWAGVKRTGENIPGSFEVAAPATVGDHEQEIPEAASLCVLGVDKQSSEAIIADVVAPNDKDERNPKLNPDDEETNLIKDADLEDMAKE